ncbi:hypothetical protein ACIQCR_17165 [Streptomyces sp. NPDC093249]|uniref:hypothetical protein n=1 Tax=unclassified Streptomyces TaxID=2593676 RepID=UPI00344C3E04
MVRILDTGAGAQGLARTLHEYELRLRALERSTQASHMSIEGGGAIDIYDEQGAHKGSIGMQPDGGVALVPVNPDPPPTPSPPTVEPVLAGLVIGWDGTWTDAYAARSDFAHVEVHVGPTADFEPGLATRAATITAQLGGTVTVAIEGYTPVWARLVAQSTAKVSGSPSDAVRGAPRQAVGQDLIDGIVSEVKLAKDSVTAAKIAVSAVTESALATNAVTAKKIVAGAVTTGHLTALAVTAEKIAALAITADKLAALSVTADKLAVNSVLATHIKAGAIDASHIKAGTLTADRLALGVDGNIVGDPSFEGSLSDERVTASPYWTIVSPGNGTPRCMQVAAASATAVTRSMTLARLPAVPGQKVWLSIDYMVSADWNGARVSLYGQWLSETGASLGYSTITTGDDAVVKGSWATMSGVPDAAAPPGTTQMRVAVSTVDSYAGTVQFDSVCCRVVLSSGVAGARAELSPQGLRLYDDGGDEAVALVTGRPNYLTFSSGGVPVATIDESGNAGFSDLAVAGSLTVAGDPLDVYLRQFARGLVAVDYQASTISASTTDFGFVELTFDAEEGRMYRVVLDCYMDPSTGGGDLVLILRDGGASTPTISSLQIQSAVYPISRSGYERIRMETIRSGYAFGAGTHRLLTTFRTQGGPTGQTVKLLGGVNHPGVMYVEDVGPYIPETGQYNTGGGTALPPIRRYTRTYKAAWSGSYSARGAYNSFYGNKLMQGYYSATNGMQSSLVGFPTSLGTDLSGATIEKAEIYLYYDHWYANSGGKAAIKAHKHTSRPSTFSCDPEGMTIPWTKNTGKWVDITRVFDSTSWRGIALDPNNSDKSYYGRARGFGETYPPQLRVTYTR